MKRVSFWKRRSGTEFFVVAKVCACHLRAIVESTAITRYLPIIITCFSDRFMPCLDWVTAKFSCVSTTFALWHFPCFFHSILWSFFKANVCVWQAFVCQSCDAADALHLGSFSAWWCRFMSCTCSYTKAGNCQHIAVVFWWPRKHFHTSASVNDCFVQCSCTCASKPDRYAPLNESG